MPIWLRNWIYNKFIETYSKKEDNPENSITNKAPKIISPPDYIYKKGQK